MITPQLIRELQNKGVKFELYGDKVRIEAPAGIIEPETRLMLSLHKPELIRILAKRHPQYFWHDYHERIGFHEIESDLPEQEAKRLAYQSTLVDYCHTLHPEIVAAYESCIFQPLWN